MATGADVRPEDADLPSGWETWGPADIRRHCGAVADRIDEIVGAHDGKSLLTQATEGEAKGEAAYKGLLNKETVEHHANGAPIPIAKAMAETAANQRLLEWKLAMGRRRAVRDELASLQAVLSALQTLFRDVMRQAGGR